MYWILGAIFSFFEAFLGFDLRKATRTWFTPLGSCYGLGFLKGDL